MKDEYDFSGGEQGKFYREGAVFRHPIYLDADLQERLEKIVRSQGKGFQDVVNDLLRHEIELLEQKL